MKSNRIQLLMIIMLIGLVYNSLKAQVSQPEKPKIAFSFDDGSTNDFGNYKLEQWNQLILDNLKKYNLKAVLFSSGKNKINERGKYVLSSWNSGGHKIANHTYSHWNFNSSKVSIDSFEIDFLRNDSIINQYSNYFKYFRFPYLKEGNTSEKINGFRKFLSEQNYNQGYVSIDASDWYIDSRLIERLSQNPKSDISGFRDYYLEHLFDRASYYDSLATKLTNRKINHVILLHHNLLAALFLDEIIQYFIDNGWDVINIDDAYQDPIYKSVPSIVPAGESIIWSLAKESGKFENVLRFPAEDSQYEKSKMDSLGL